MLSFHRVKYYHNGRNAMFLRSPGIILLSSKSGSFLTLSFSSLRDHRVLCERKSYSPRQDAAVVSTLENITTHRPKGLPCGNCGRAQLGNSSISTGRVFNLSKIKFHSEESSPGARRHGASGYGIFRPPGRTAQSLFRILSAAYDVRAL